jgi:hypothetical protein
MPYGSHLTLAELKLDLVILGCAASAGIHGALVREHYEEGVAAGIAFALATVLLAAAAIALTRRPSEPALLATSGLFAGLIAAYALATTTGLPLLHPDREAVDGLALFTKGVEALGLMLACGLVAQPSRGRLLQPKGQIT